MPGSRSTQRETDAVNLTMSVCVCVKERERERDSVKEREGERDMDHPTAVKKNKAGWREKSASITLEVGQLDMVVW